MKAASSPLQWLWPGALASFILAGSTGALIRFAFIYGFPAGLQYANLRHAHSHLMYFAWVTPLLMGLTSVTASRRLHRPLPASLSWATSLTLAAGLSAFLPFLLSGYAPTTLFGVRLPLSVIASTLNILAWYVFAAAYWRFVRRAPRDLPLRLFDLALAFLLLASLGAWGRAVLAALKISDPFWAQAMLFLFLDQFSDGWFLLGLLGLLHAALPSAARSRFARPSALLLVLGLPLAFLLSVSADLLPPSLRLLASLSGGLVALGLSGQLLSFWPALSHVEGPALSPVEGTALTYRSRWTLRTPLLFLLLKALFMAGLSLPALALWGQRLGLRLFYLHTMLLGFVSLALLAAVAAVWGPRLARGWRAFHLAVLLVLLSLLPTTALWPAALSGPWTLHFTAWSSLAPLLVASAMLIDHLAPPGTRAHSKPSPARHAMPESGE